MSPRSSKGVKMKTVNKIKEKKHKTIKKPKVKAKKEKVLIVAQEIKFARLLSGNEKKTRDRVLKTFKKWLLNCFTKGYEFKEDDFTRVWKGLFYAVWMSDKPLVQEELCETIAGILDLFPPEQIKYALMMTKAGFKVLATEWFGIDHHRMDKFLMLIRRYLRGSLRCLRRCEWSLKSCQMYSDMLSGPDGVLCPKTPLYARNAGSMLLHIVDCFLEELSKVSEGAIPDASLVTLLRPFSVYMCKGESTSLCVAARRVHTALLRQSEHGLEYNSKTKAWEQMGCPRGGPDALELMSDDETDDHNDDDEEKMTESPLDPRAGRVDVVVAPLPVPAAMIAAMLKELLASASSKAYKRTNICLQRFEQLSKDVYPLPVPDVRDDDDVIRPRAVDAAMELKALDSKLVRDSDELALRGLSRKHRKRLLAKSRAGLSIVEDIKPDDKLQSATNGNWEVQSTEPVGKKANKHKTDTSNKENVNKNKKSKKRKNSDVEANQQNKKQKCDVEVNKNDNAKTDLFVKKSYEKNTKSKNIKKQKLLNGFQDNKLANGIPGSNKKEKVEVNKQASNEKHKKAKEVVATKSDEKLVKKKVIPDTKTEKVLTKSNKQNPKNATPKKQMKQQKNQKPSPTLLVNKVKNYQKKTSADKQISPQKKLSYDTPKKVKFVLKNNSMQGPVDYYRSVRQSPNIPFDSSKRPSKTNLKVSTPSPINPFFKKKLRLK